LLFFGSNFSEGVVSHGDFFNKLIDFLLSFTTVVRNLSLNLIKLSLDVISSLMNILNLIVDLCNLGSVDYGSLVDIIFTFIVDFFNFLPVLVLELDDILMDLLLFIEYNSSLVGDIKDFVVSFIDFIDHFFELRLGFLDQVIVLVLLSDHSSAVSVQHLLQGSFLTFVNLNLAHFLVKV